MNVTLFTSGLLRRRPMLPKPPPPLRFCHRCSFLPTWHIHTRKNYIRRHVHATLITRHFTRYSQH